MPASRCRRVHRPPRLPAGPSARCVRRRLTRKAPRSPPRRRSTPASCADAHADRSRAAARTSPRCLRRAGSRSRPSIAARLASMPRQRRAGRPARPTGQWSSRAKTVIPPARPIARLRSDVSHPRPRRSTRERHPQRREPVEPAQRGAALPAQCRVRRPGERHRGHVRGRSRRSARVLGRAGARGCSGRPRGARRSTGRTPRSRGGSSAASSTSPTTASTATSRRATATRSPSTGRASRATRARSPTPTSSARCRRPPTR